MSVTIERFFVFRFFAIQLSARKQNGFDAMHVRAVGIFSLLALGVVFTVDSGPLFGDLASGEP